MKTSEDAIGFLAVPDEAGPHPGVVMFPDVWGLSDHYRNLAGRLARAGYAVLAIDPYRKTGHPELTDPASAQAWIAEIDDRVVLETVQEAIDTLTANAAVAGRKIGIVGFCMGGQYTLLAACGCTGLAACAPFYGMVRYREGLDPDRKPRQPLDALGDLSCPVLGLYGAEDPLIPIEDVRELETRLAASGQPSEVVVYEGAGHAFMNETRPAMHRPDQAREAWARLLPFLAERLA